MRLTHSPTLRSRLALLDRRKDLVNSAQVREALSRSPSSSCITEESISFDSFMNFQFITQPNSTTSSCIV